MKINLTPNHGFLSHAVQHFIMRTFIFMLCATTFALSPNSGFSQDASITIAKHQTLSLEEVFDLIKAQTNYNFVYRSNRLIKAPTLEVSSGVYKTSELLNTGLDRIGYQYAFENNVVIVSRKQAQTPTAPLQQQVTVTGVVRDSLGVPLGGATVKVKDSKKVTATSLDGEFKLMQVEVGATLVFSYIGFLDRELVVTPDNAKNLVVTLKEDVSTLEEVVLVSTGYQTLPKERSAGSYSKPDMDVFQNRSSTMSVADRLDGLVPGLTVNRSPGAAYYNPVLVRGSSSLAINTNPLIVVDGVPIADLNIQSTDALDVSGLLNINPQDIRDITVLKDATAASIWGARAANGVIVINTKRGSSTGEVEFLYDTFITLEGVPDQGYLNQLNSNEFIQVAESIFDPERNPYEDAVGLSIYGSGNGISPHEQILYDQYRGVISDATARRRLDSLSSIDNRGQIEELFYRPSVLTTHTLSVSAGKNGYTFYGSGNYTDTQSHTPGEKDHRYKLNLRQNFEIGKRFKFDLITDLTYHDKFKPNNITVNSRFLPYQLFRDANGNNIEMSYMTELNTDIRRDIEDAAQLDLSYTPLNELDYAYTKSKTKSIRNVLGVDVALFEGLSFRGTYSYTSNGIDDEEYKDHLSIGQRTEVAEFAVVNGPGEAPTYLLPNTGGKYSTGSTDIEAWTIRNQLSYVKEWNNRMHQLNVIAGQEAQQQQTIRKISNVRGYDDRTQTYTFIDYGALQANVYNVAKPNTLNAAQYGAENLFSRLPVSEGAYFGRSETTTRFSSWYANAAYTFDQKYTVNGSVRNDQSNLFGLDKSAQNKPVWSAGAKWNLGREHFLQDVTWLSSLDLRATYGLAGNAPNPGTAASFDILRPSTNLWVSGLYIQTAGNSKLTWERTATTNFGLDFNLFGRLSGSVDYYQRRTTDLLGNYPTNPLTGYSTVTGNLGDLRNDGIEVALKSRIIALKDFSWDSFLNLAFNKNKITKVRLTEETTSGDTRVLNDRWVEGYANFPVFAYDYVGLDENGDPQIRLADGSITKDPNVTTPEDVKYMGTSQPKWNGGFGNTLRYKNLSLNINVVYNFGYVMFRDANTFYSGTRLDASNYSFTTGNIRRGFLDRWKVPGDEARTDVPRYTATVDATRNTNYYVYGDENVFDASHIKIRDINLMCRLPHSIFGVTGIEQVTVRGQVSNILLWAANDYDIDPEYHSYNGFRNLKPGPRITLGLNVKF